MIKSYRDFELWIQGDIEKGYTVRANVSGGGSVPSCPFVFSCHELFGRWSDNARRQSFNERDVQTLGEGLFNTLFPPQIAKFWAGARHSLREEEGLRVKLHIESPELMNLPWELVFEAEYIGLRLRFPIVRYLALPDLPRPLFVQPPLRVLVFVSQPKGTLPLDPGAELAKIRQALAQSSEQVELQVCDLAGRDELLTRLRQGYHVLHFIGHGKFEDGEGYLILEDLEEHSSHVSASSLAQVVADSSLRLVVLNACETSMVGAQNVFSGVAHQLVRVGVPAVVAMQLAVSEKCAAAFSHGFYGALANGWPVDAAVQEGRRSIMNALENDWKRCAEWAIPTLYMRAPEGVIFRLEKERAGDDGAYERLAQTLEQVAEYNRKLQEWKELHHLLQDHLVTLRPLLSAIDLIYYKVETWSEVQKERIASSWNDYERELDSLQLFAEHRATHISHTPFRGHEEHLQGDPWVLDFIQMERTIGALLDEQNIKGLRKRARLGELRKQAYQLYSICTRHLNVVDSRIRLTADKIDDVLSGAL